MSDLSSRVNKALSTVKQIAEIDNAYEFVKTALNLPALTKAMQEHRRDLVAKLVEDWPEEKKS